MRLVSLLPSATEIVYALGLGDDLVGVTFECEVPAADRAGKTVVVGGTDTHGMSPGEIDAHVRAQLAAGADLYTLHADALSGLDPELILTQDLCRVCALPSGHVADALDHLGCRADVLSLDPYTLDEVLDSVLAVGAAAGVPERAGDLVGALDQLVNVTVEVGVLEQAYDLVALLQQGGCAALDGVDRIPLGRVLAACGAALAVADGADLGEVAHRGVLSAGGRRAAAHASWVSAVRLLRPVDRARRAHGFYDRCERPG